MTLDTYPAASHMGVRYLEWDEIFNVMEARHSAQSPIIKSMIEVRDRYNGDWVLPDLSSEVAETMGNLTPQLITDTVDSYGQRAGSVMPALRSPAINPGKQKGIRSREYANIRSGILLATYKKNRMNLQMRKIFRHMVAYGTGALVTLPDFHDGYMRISLRDPLTAFPDPVSGEDYRDPENVGFIFSKSADWIAYRFPETRELMWNHPQASEVMWNMVEWVDCDCVVIGLMGPHEYPSPHGAGGWRVRDWTTADWSMELRRYRNPIGKVPCVVPGRVTLDRMGSNLAGLIGHADIMARMMALDMAAKEKAIYPDKYIIGKNGQVPRLIGGKWKDGRTGDINVISDADGIGSLNFTSDPTASQAYDRIERNFRVSSGLVPQMGGETYGALRTGRGIDSLMGASVDPKIQEMHTTMETWLEYLNECVLEGYKAYWPNKQFTMPTGKWRKEVEFVPSEHIETVANEVNYAIAGADVQGQTITLGQMLGMKVISRKSFMERHPFIGDAVAEQAMIDEESMEEATLQALMQAIAAQQAPPIMLAFIEEERRKDPDGDLITAVMAANRRMQEMQAQEAPAPEPGQIAPPESQPGLAGPAQQPAPAAQPGIETPPDMAQLRTLLNALGQTSGVVTRA